LCLVLAHQASGVSITNPTNNTIWTTSGPNTISWIFQAGDPSFMNIRLLHNNVSNFQPIVGLLSADGMIATGIDITTRYQVFTPSCLPGNPSLPTGTGYSLQILSASTTGSYTVLNSTHGTFSIVAADANMCTSFVSAVSAMPSSTSTETNLSWSSSPKYHIGVIAGGVIGGLLFCLLIVAVCLLYKRYSRDARQKKTRDFIIKKGLITRMPVANKEFGLSF